MFEVPMDHDKEKEEISLIGRIFSLEALLIVMGVLSLAAGIFNRNGTRIFLGIAVLTGGIILLVFVRKRFTVKR
jgi:hypothetical protein